MGKGNGWDDDLQLGRPLTILIQRFQGSMDSGWRILRQDKKGEVIKEIVLKGPFVNGLASHVELRTFEPASYTLRMTLVQPSP